MYWFCSFIQRYPWGLWKIKDIMNSWLLKHFMFFSPSRVWCFFCFLFFFWHSHCPILGQRAPPSLVPFGTFSSWQHPCFLVWANTPGSQRVAETQPSRSLKLSSFLGAKPSCPLCCFCCGAYRVQGWARGGLPDPCGRHRRAVLGTLDEACVCECVSVCVWVLGPAPHRD